ncbi:MAG TPA: M55 family metallopeptidase [Bryobacteraceae bacterium]|nr:M55 family metallopeptidase [Bryobacteraceae bacterium]
MRNLTMPRVIAAGLLAALLLSAQDKRPVFVITDAEGIAGVCRQDLTEAKDPELRQLLTGEVNAAVEGFLSAGASEVIVWDGHDGSQTLSALTIHPKAKLLIGGLGPTLTLDRHYAAVAFVGQHSRANVRGGVMAHSYSSLGIQALRVNGKAMGEIETRAALAGFYQTPVIFLSGDTAAVQELKAVVPGAETVAVKEGLGRYTCLSMSAEEARERTREGARRAFEKIGAARPYRIEGPVTVEIEHTTRNSLPIGARFRPFAEVVDDLTIRYRGKDFLEAWTRAWPE